jgi:hypothetical protein
MKRSIIAALLTVTAGSALANNPFDFQRQFGSEEYVHGADAAHMTFAPVERSDFVPSGFAWTLNANVDGIAMNDFQGTIIKSGPSRISLYEVYRGSSEGTAYRDYHERYPADTDWDRIAREYRESQMDKGLVSGINADDNRS